VTEGGRFGNVGQRWKYGEKPVNEPMQPNQGGQMNVLDQKFAEFQKLSADERITHFKRNGHLFDMIISQQLDRKILDEIYEITNELRGKSKSKAGALYMQNLLPHKRAMLFFSQPSSRTFLSFMSACHLVGMRTSEIRDPRVSSEVKGETFDDSLRTFSSYTDLIIMRTSQKDMAERAAWLMNTYSNRPVPVINGGSGSDQHPTQAILDIYTLQRSFEDHGGLDGKTILMCGDLRRGRTVRSLSLLMKNFQDVKIIYTAPKPFQMEQDLLDFLEQHKIPYVIETESLDKMLPEADAIYMTRIQDEHDKSADESAKIDTSKFKLGLEQMSKVKPHAIIMHPFPRRDEIDVAIDVDLRAMYWRQERNGMWTRAALIAYIFRVHHKILEY
jgi:aspartate carbamoyltransferase catalytic subunit